MKKFALGFMALSMSSSAFAAPQTLFELVGAKRPAIGIQNSVLVIIDAQNEYVSGQLPLPGIARKIKTIGALLKEARKQGTPVIHVVHSGSKGMPFDPAGPGFAIIPALKPQSGETIVTKTLPNAFAKTDLQAQLEKLGSGRHLLLTGFMTHMCISSTARAALDLGRTVAVVTDAVGTRDLRGVDGKTVSAETVNSIALAELQDRFAWMVTSDELMSPLASAK